MNVSSRMESSTQPNHVQISHNIYKKIKDDSYFSFSDRGSIPIKGKGELKAYFVSKADVALIVDNSQMESISLPGTV
jgi:adenylate cyclase